MKKTAPTATMTARSSARPETVYDVLADLHSHLEWAGKRQSADYRLTSLQAPDGPAQVGTVFSSTGKIPMSPAYWSDRSTVTAADRPALFEFVTEAEADARRPVTSRWLNRYEIKRAEGGCIVTHKLSLLQVQNPFLRLRFPMQAMTFKFGIPMYSRRGLRNLLEVAEEREKASAALIQQPAR